MLEEVELQGALVVADDGFAVRSDARLGDADAHLAGLLEALCVGGDVEHVNAAVLDDFLVIHPLGPGDGANQDAQRCAEQQPEQAGRSKHTRHR